MRKRIWRYLIAAVAPTLLAFLVKWLYRTYRLEIAGTAGAPGGGGPHIFGIWHGDFFAFAGYAHAVIRRDMTVMTSTSADGQLLADIIRRLGGTTVRGDERRGGIRALRQLLGAFRAGEHIVFALDGPLGPRHIVKTGVLVASRNLGSGIVPVTVRAGRVWRFNSWDRFYIPLPFSHVSLKLGAPVAAGDGELETQRAALAAAMGVS